MTFQIWTSEVSFHEPVAIHDRVEPVSDGKNRAIGELDSYRLLYQLVRLQVDRCCGFIEDENLGFVKQRPCKADKLSLTNTENLFHVACNWVVGIKA